MRGWGAAARYFLIVLFAFFEFSVGPARAEASPDSVRTVGGVIDYASLLSTEKRKALEIAAGQLARRVNTDFFVVTIDDRSALWADQRSHYAMVQKAFTDISAAITKHFGRPAPLTVLLVFKSSVVLHMKTSDDDLQERLMFRSFYRGADGALERIRRANESHAEAAQRYLGLFETALDEIAAKSAGDGLEATSEQARFWLFQKTALLSSRNLMQHSFLDPLYKTFVGLMSAATGLAGALFPKSGWIVFLAFMGGLYLMLQGASYYVEHAKGDRGALIGDFVLTGMFGLPLFILFAVSQGDLENLLYISQKFGGDLLTYLDWSSQIEAHSFEMPFAVILSGALVISLIESFIRLSRFLDASKQAIPASALTKGKRTLGMFGLLAGWVWHTLSAFGWIMSLVIWPGIVAAFFLIVSLLRRLIDLAGYSKGTSKKDRQAEDWSPRGPQGNKTLLSSGGTQ